MKRSLNSPVLYDSPNTTYPFKKARYCLDTPNVVDKIDPTINAAQLLAHITESLKGKEAPYHYDDDILSRKQVKHTSELPIRGNSHVWSDQDTKDDYFCVLEVEDFFRYVRDTFHEGSAASSDSLWISKFNELKNFYEKHGSCYIHHNSGPLGFWCAYMRYLHRNGHLSLDKRRLLETIGFDFKTEWEKKFEEVNDIIKQHKPLHGHHKCWMDKQNELLIQGKLDEHCSKLFLSLNHYIKQTIQAQKTITREVVETLTFLSSSKCVSPPPSPTKTASSDGLKNLLLESAAEDEEVKEEEDEQDEEIPDENDEEEEEEIQETRKTKKRKPIRGKSRKARKPPRGDSKQKWHDSYNELVKYYMAHGNTIINRGDNYHLGTWTALQRSNRRRGRLPDHKVELLNKIGFQWEALRLGPSSDRNEK